MHVHYFQVPRQRLQPFEQAMHAGRGEIIDNFQKNQPQYFNLRTSIEACLPNHLSNRICRKLCIDFGEINITKKDTNCIHPL